MQHLQGFSPTLQVLFQYLQVRVRDDNDSLFLAQEFCDGWRGTGFFHILLEMVGKKPKLLGQTPGFDSRGRDWCSGAAQFTGDILRQASVGQTVDTLGQRGDADGKRNFDKAMDKLIAELQEKKAQDWSAHFACVLALKVPGENVQFFEGRVEGKIVPEKSGSKGFGFDPVFMPEGSDKTFANFTFEEKAKISHRGRAFAKLLDFLK